MIFISHIGQFRVKREKKKNILKKLLALTKVTRNIRNETENCLWSWQVKLIKTSKYVKGLNNIIIEVEEDDTYTIFLKEAAF